MYSKQPLSIQALFDSIALRYDAGNSLLSFHMHALWNRRLAHTLMDLARPTQMADLCAGTGDITIRALRYLCKQAGPLPKMHLVDISQEMLTVAKKRLQDFPQEVQDKLSFIQADVQNLQFQDGSMDAISIAYGIRNVPDIRACLKEAHRVLKSGGWIGIAELTRPKRQPMHTLHNLYLRTVVPFVGKWAIRNEEAYRYLCGSIQAFICPEELIGILESEGFGSCLCSPQAAGIATLIFAQKQ